VTVFLVLTASRRGSHRSQQRSSGGLFFATDDVRVAYEELKDRGVDAGFRGPSGNQMRVAQLNPAFTGA
jgi:hypothetical protein